MPSGHVSNFDPALPEQSKLCNDCHGPLSLDAASMAPYFSAAGPNDAAMICQLCRERMPAPRGGLATEQPTGVSVASLLNIDVARHSLQANSAGESPPLQIDTQSINVRPLDLDTGMNQYRAALPPPDLQAPQRRPTLNHPASLTAQRHTSTSHGASPVSSFKRPPINPVSPVDAYPSPLSAGASSRNPSHLGASPDPMVDITRLRVRSQGYGCLYPGAVFQGTQKSGRNSYDVNVTIVDVDFSSSFLCGYLRIRGLTDDWPELTTYFDAEIIGSRHGFVTQGWGASEQEDMVHWARFPAFCQVQNELEKPRLTMKDRDRGAVFMRWKERFLVPDHRVQDINGASFAGFYYVCVDFRPQQPPTTLSPIRTVAQEMPVCPEGEILWPSVPQSAKPETPFTTRHRSASTLRSPRRASTAGTSTTEEPVATMCGFYFHQSSEPYQQLSLTHVKERTTSSFEFR